MEQENFEKNREAFDEQDLEKSDFGVEEEIKKEDSKNTEYKEVEGQEEKEREIGEGEGEQAEEENQSPYQIRKQEQKQSEGIKKQSVQGKIQHFLDLARTQGIVEAIQAVKKMNDPYLLDLFHDALAKQGLFKKFLKDKKD